jgi:hypothetical protein
MQNICDIKCQKYSYLTHSDTLGMFFFKIKIIDQIWMPNVTCISWKNIFILESLVPLTMFAPIWAYQDLINI